MITALLVCAIGLMVTLAAGKPVLAALRRLRAGQEIRTDGPVWHRKKAGTPTMGGLMFILGCGIAIIILGLPFFTRGVFVHLYVYVFALAFGLIGFADDFRKVTRHQNEGLTAVQKFLLQLAAAMIFLTLMRYEHFLTNHLYVPGLRMTFTVPWIPYLVFAAFVIVGCVNAVNLTDGIDGLAASVTLVVSIFFTLAGLLISADGAQALFPAALTGSLAAFLVYNHHPAQVFMGDTGSLFLGGAVAALAFAMDMPLILIPVGVVYIVETLSDIIQVTYFKYTRRRTGTGKRIFKMAPLHHHLEKSGWSEEKIVLIFSMITCLIAYLAIYAGR